MLLAFVLTAILPVAVAAAAPPGVTDFSIAPAGTTTVVIANGQNVRYTVNQAGTKDLIWDPSAGTSSSGGAEPLSATNATYTWPTSQQVQASGNEATVRGTVSNFQVRVAPNNAYTWAAYTGTDNTASDSRNSSPVTLNCAPVSVATLGVPKDAQGGNSSNNPMQVAKGSAASLTVQWEDTNGSATPLTAIRDDATACITGNVTYSWRIGNTSLAASSFTSTNQGSTLTLSANDTANLTASTTPIQYICTATVGSTTTEATVYVMVGDEASSETGTISIAAANNTVQIPDGADSAAVTATLSSGVTGAINATFTQVGTTGTSAPPTITATGNIASGTTTTLTIRNIKPITDALLTANSVQFDLTRATVTPTNGSATTLSLGTSISVKFTKLSSTPSITGLQITGNNLVVAYGTSVTPSGWAVTAKNGNNTVTSATGAPSLYFDGYTNTATAGMFASGQANVTQIDGRQLMPPTPLSAVLGTDTSAPMGVSIATVTVAELYAKSNSSYTKTAPLTVTKAQSGAVTTSLDVVWSADGKNATGLPAGGEYAWTVIRGEDLATGVSLNSSGTNAILTVDSNAEPGDDYVVMCDWKSGPGADDPHLDAQWNLTILPYGTPSLTLGTTEVALGDGSAGLTGTTSNVPANTSIALTLEPPSGVTANPITLRGGVGTDNVAGFNISLEDVQAIRDAMGTQTSIEYTLTATIPDATSTGNAGTSITVVPGSILFLIQPATLAWDTQPTNLQVGESCNASVVWDTVPTVTGTSGQINYTWSATSNAVRITPSADGTSATITALEPAPSVRITATAQPTTSWETTPAVSAVSQTISITESSGITATLNPTTLSLTPGGTATVNAVVTGSETVPTYSWSSSNTAVATVAGDGNAATVTAVSAGTATISCAMTMGATALTRTCTVTVAGPQTPGYTVAISGPTAVTAGNNIALSAIVTPPSGQTVPSTLTYNWYVADGTANVRITNNGRTATVAGITAGTTATIAVSVSGPGLAQPISATYVVRITAAGGTTTPTNPPTTPTSAPTASPTASPGTSAAPTSGPTSGPSTAPSENPITPVPDSPVDFEVVDNPTVGGDALEGIEIDGSTGITPSVADLLTFSNLPAGAVMTITTPEGSAVAWNTPTSTGQVVTVRDADGNVISQATVVVKGDVLGTGKINLSQVVRMAAAFRGTEPLEGAFLAAGQWVSSGAGQSITLTDLVLEARLYREAGMQTGR